MIWWILSVWLYGAVCFVAGCWWVTIRQKRMVHLTLSEDDPKRYNTKIVTDLNGWYDQKTLH